MTTKRPRAAGDVFKVPPLKLDGGGRGDSSASSAPTPVTSTRIACPVCRHERNVYEWADWPQLKEVVYGCAYRHRTTGKLCGNLWVESHRGGWCHVCFSPARIQEHDEGLLRYWCATCNNLSSDQKRTKMY